MKLTNKQRKVLQDEQARVVVEAEQIFFQQMEGKIKEGSEEGEMVAFLKHYFADAFWQGYLFATIEQTKGTNKC